MDYFSADLRYSGSICISGLTAAGKTTHAHLICGEFGLTYVSGSQIQLNFSALSPIQTRDFWISDEAKKLWNEKDFRRIDEELLRLESKSTGYIFDTSTMPWRHKHPALCIWLESDLDSRILKSIISHRGAGRFDINEYRQLIIKKDAATTSLYKNLYGIDIGEDWSCFDLVIDISNLVNEPTLDASLRSIHAAHEVIRSATAWYLTKREDFFNDFRETISRNEQIIRVNRLFDNLK